MSAHAKPNARVARYQELLRAAVKELGVPKTDTRAIMSATLHMAREHLQSRLLRGADIDVAELLHLDEALKGIAPTAPAELEVFLIDGNDVCCKCGGPNLCEACGQKKSPKHNRRTLEDAQAAKAKAPLLALSSPAPAASASPAPAPGQARAVPVAPKPAPAPPRFTSIHDAAEASGAVGVSDRGIAFSGGRRDGFSPADGGTPTW
jgi:hypothetical protein